MAEQHSGDPPPVAASGDVSAASKGRRGDDAARQFAVRLARMAAAQTDASGELLHLAVLRAKLAKAQLAHSEIKLQIKSELKELADMKKDTTELSKAQQSLQHRLSAGPKTIPKKQ